MNCKNQELRNKGIRIFTNPKSTSAEKEDILLACDYENKHSESGIKNIAGSDNKDALLKKWRQWFERHMAFEDEDDVDGGEDGDIA